MYKWVFDETKSGRYQGINDSGIETFNTNIVKSLIRETIQNSLDARNNLIETNVIVKFALHKIKVSEIPESAQLVNILKMCIIEANQRDDEKAKQIYKKMVEKLHEDFIQVLVISDFNTVGLSQIESDYGTFSSLVNSDGYSQKSDLKKSGGSFGIGKNAAFSASKIRTVFYNTMNINGETGFQGVTIQTSHKDPYSGNKMLAKGIFPQKPILNNSKYFENIIKRDKPGTDLIILCFESENFVRSCINEVLNSFLVSLEKKKLAVDVCGTVINSETYAKYIKQNINALELGFMNFSKIEKYDIIKTSQLYSALKSNVYLKTIKIGSIIDSIEIYINVSKDDEHINEFIGVRHSGMNVHSFKRFGSAINFAGIVFIDNVEINHILQSMENPLHNSWEVDRHPDGKNVGVKVLATIRKAIKEVITSHISTDETDEILVNGANALLIGDSYELSSVSKKIKLRQKTFNSNDQQIIDINFIIECIEKIYGDLTPSEKLKIINSKANRVLNYLKIKRTLIINNNHINIILDSNINCNAVILIKPINCNDYFDILSVDSDLEIVKFNKSMILIKGLKSNTQHTLNIKTSIKNKVCFEVDIYDIKK